jgi:hypothetical protein
VPHFTAHAHKQRLHFAWDLVELEISKLLSSPGKEQLWGICSDLGTMMIRMRIERHGQWRAEKVRYLDQLEGK